MHLSRFMNLSHTVQGLWPGNHNSTTHGCAWSNYESGTIILSWRFKRTRRSTGQLSADRRTTARTIRSKVCHGITKIRSIWAEMSGNFGLRTCAPCEGSDQPARSRSLIRIVTGRILDNQGYKVSKIIRTMETLIRLRRSQFDLSLCLAHLSEGSFLTKQPTRIIYRCHVHHGTPYFPICPFDITRKDAFCFTFYFEWKYFVLIDHILSETICLFCFCVLFSNMYPNINFRAKNWSDLCNLYNKVIFFFFNFCLRDFFFLFFAEFELLMFRSQIVKISEKLNKRNLLKICLQVTYPSDFCIICIRFPMEKSENIWFFLKVVTRIFFVCIDS